MFVADKATSLRERKQHRRLGCNPNFDNNHSKLWARLQNCRVFFIFDNLHITTHRHHWRLPWSNVCMSYFTVINGNRWSINVVTIGANGFGPFPTAVEPKVSGALACSLYRVINYARLAINEFVLGQCRQNVF